MQYSKELADVLKENGDYKFQMSGNDKLITTVKIGEHIFVIDESEDYDDLNQFSDADEAVAEILSKVMDCGYEFRLEMLAGSGDEDTEEELGRVRSETKGVVDDFSYKIYDKYFITDEEIKEEIMKFAEKDYIFA